MQLEVASTIIELIINFLSRLLARTPRISHPQEPQLATPCADSVPVVTEWLKSWSVPAEYHDYWQSKPIRLTYEVGFADTLAETRVNPMWCTPGVLAHEMAHQSWFTLTEEQREEYAEAYLAIQDSDPNIVYLYSQNNYGMVSYIESHAEIYRYLTVPESLRKFYPKLMEV